MVDDDPFWACALHYNDEEGRAAERDWLVPGTRRQEEGGSRSDSYLLPTHSTAASTEELLRVQVCEVRGQGCFDCIWGEVWEASFLLSASLLVHLEKSNYVRVLELGAGVALPGKLLLEFSRHTAADLHVCLTDHDPQCLATLRRQLIHEGAIEAVEYTGTHNDRDDPNPMHTRVTVAHLDWEHPKAFTDREVGVEGLQFDLAIGSALCYSPEHVTPLIETLRHLFSVCRVRECVIVQIRDRAGFQRLVRRLESEAKGEGEGEGGAAGKSWCSVSLEEVSQAVYDLAQSITREVAGGGQGDGVGGGEGMCERDGQGEEEGVAVRSTFAFPLGLGLDGRALVQGQGGAGLLTTPREAFALLRVKSLL